MEIEYIIELQEEHDSPEGFFASGDEEIDRQTVQTILDDYNAGNPWAWCCIKVIARVEFEGQEFKGETYLGCCSYEDEKDFKAGGYYEQMCQEALESLMGHLAADSHRGELAEDIYRSLTGEFS